MSKTLSDVFKLFDGVLNEEEIYVSDLLSDISNTIIKYRLELGMNQKEFASLLGVSQAMVSKWESEQYNFTIETLAKICRKLNLELNVRISNQEKLLVDQNKYSQSAYTVYDVSR